MTAQSRAASLAAAADYGRRKPTVTYSHPIAPTRYHPSPVTMRARVTRAYVSDIDGIRLVLDNGHDVTLREATEVPPCT